MSDKTSVITRRNLFRAAAGVVAGARLQLPELPMQIAAAPMIAHATVAAPAVETWTAMAMRLGSSLQIASYRVANWQNNITLNNITLSDLNKQRIYRASPVPQEEAEAYVREKLEEMFTGILTPYRGFYDLKKAVFAGPPAEDERKETALRQIIAVKETHYWAELQHIAYAIPDIDLDEAFEALAEKQRAADRKDFKDSEMIEHEYKMLALYSFRRNMTLSDEQEYAKKRTLGEHITWFHDYNGLLEEMGLATAIYKTEVKARADNLQNHLAAVAKGVGLDADLANAITDADLTMVRTDNSEDWSLDHLRQDSAFFAQLARKISERMSSVVGGAQSTFILEAVQKEMPGAYLGALKKVFTDVDTTMLPVPEISEQVFRDWPARQGWAEQDMQDELGNRGQIVMEQPVFDATKPQGGETSERAVVDILNTAANIVKRVVDGDIAVHLAEHGSVDSGLEPAAAIAFEPIITQPFVPENKEKKPVTTGREPA